MNSISEEEKESPRIILLIMNCKKYQFKADLQRKTWLPLIPKEIIYYHVLGDPDLDSEFVFLEEERKLIVKVEDDYNSLPKKVIAAYNAVFQTFEFQYIFKTDDDQELKNIKFFETLTGILLPNEKEKDNEDKNNEDKNNEEKEKNNKKENKVGKRHYGGYVVDVEQPYLSQYHKIHPELPEHLPVYSTKYCSGRFYFLSYAAIGYLIRQREKIEQEYLEDYAIGLNLHDFFKENLLLLNTGKYFREPTVPL
jgi:hypothetical protein